MKRLPLAFATLFAVAHTQSPLYYSNQNQYFLHGAALAGVGDLAHDWLANTTDPTPLFSGLIALSLKHSGEWPFQVIYFLAQMLYFLAAWWLVQPRSGWLFASLFTLVHAGFLRWCSDRLLGADYLWFFQCGLANQYILGPGLQPSVIGIALLGSLAAYRNDRTLLAVGLAAGANLIHSTYLLAAALLIAGYLFREMQQKNWRTVGLGAALAIALVIPPIVWIFTAFKPDPESFDFAQRILSEVRIPHHTRPARWFDAVAALQILWILAGWLALRRSRLFVPIGIALTLALMGTVLVLLTDNPTLSLMFPWRISAVLIPLATATLLKQLAERFTRFSFPVSAAAFAVAIGGAIAVVGLELGYREPKGEEAAMDFISSHRSAGEVYLVPARFPKPTTARGVYSNTFTKAPDPSAVVYFEMARFRLRTGAALYIDFKAIPYKDTEVLEWYHRVEQCEKWFQESDWDRRGVIDELTRAGITHVVAPIQTQLNSTRLQFLYEGGAYRVYKVK